MARVAVQNYPMVSWIEIGRLRDFQGPPTDHAKISRRCFAGFGLSIIQKLKFHDFCMLTFLHTLRTFDVVLFFLICLKGKRFRKLSNAAKTIAKAKMSAYRFR